MSRSSYQSGSYFVGTKLPTYKEEHEADEVGKRIKGMPERRGSQWESYGFAFVAIVSLIEIF